MRKYIDQEAAQKIVCSICEVCRNPTLETLMSCEICPGFAKIPVEDVQPVVHGRWIETEQPMGWDNESCATCSVCGEDFVLDEWGIDDVRREMHYCMNCGAKMDLED